jgi:hypothetical protein
MKGSGLISKQAQWVMDSLKTRNGCTYRELAKDMGLDNPNLCSRRLSGLRDMGLVVNGEPRVCTIGRSRMQTWWLASTLAVIG